MNLSALWTEIICIQAQTKICYHTLFCCCTTLQKQTGVYRRKKNKETVSLFFWTTDYKNDNKNNDVAQIIQGGQWGWGDTPKFWVGGRHSSYPPINYPHSYEKLPFARTIG